MTVQLESPPPAPPPTGTRSRGPAHGDDGSVTAETAVVLPCLLLVLAVLVAVLAVVAGQLRCVDAARSAARLAARGDVVQAVRAEAALRAPDGAVVQVVERGDRVVVQVQARVHPLGWLARRLPGVEVQAEATALRESTVGAP